MKYRSNGQVRILFLGTPKIARMVLSSLLDASFDVVGVVTQEDKPVGRKGILTPSPVKELALEKGIPVYQPHRIRKDYEWAKDLSFDVIVCIAYGQIIPMELIDLAPKKALNLHGSLLPKLRGAAPIQRAIMNGESVTGVTLMEMVAAMDAGRMYDKAEVRIEESDNATSLFEKIGQAASELIVKDLLAYMNDELPGIPQDENEVTFADKILPEEEHLSLNLKVKDLWNAIRGLSEEPGGYFYLEEKKLKIYRAHVESFEVNREVGSIIPNRKRFLLQCLDGVLSLDEVQWEGKKRMDAASFRNGAHLPDDARLI